MTTFKKKDFKKLVIESSNIDEFVNDDGSMIGGDEKYNKGVDVKTGPVNMPDDKKGLSLTTDKHAANAIQPRNWWWSLTYGGGSGRSMGSPVGSNLENDGGFTESIDESELTSEQRMRNMVEDILAKQSNSQDLVKRGGNSDVNRNAIPDIDDLSDTKMIVVGKLTDLIDTIRASNLSGEEIGIVLNHLLSNIDSSQLPSDYKHIIRKQL